MIFFPVVIFPVQALGKLKEAVNQTDYKDRVDEEQLRWFLLDRKLDWMEAQSKLISMLKWRERIGCVLSFWICMNIAFYGSYITNRLFSVVYTVFLGCVNNVFSGCTSKNILTFHSSRRSDDLQTTDIAKEAATGKAYIHTHLDVLDRPVLVVRASKHVLGASPLESSEQLCSFLLDRAIEKLPPGQKTILGIFDLRGFSTRNADIQFATFLIDAFFTYYPKRVSQVLIVEAPWVFTPVYNVVKPLLRKYAALVRFVSVEEVRREYFTPSTLPEDFQGKGFPKD